MDRLKRIGSWTFGAMLVSLVVWGVTTPNMRLALPVPGVTPGPTYATMQNTAFTAVDAHDHTSGKGVAVPSAGINVNADLAFNDRAATNLLASVYYDQPAALSTLTDAPAVYSTGGELTFNDGAGNVVPITSHGSVVGSAGTITGLPSGTASASYSSGAGSFIFKQATNSAAYTDTGPVIIRDTAVGASIKGVTLKSPVSLAADYSITMPGGLPASTLPISISSSGILAASVLTKPMLPAVGEQCSGSSGSFSTQSTSYVDVTNLTVTLTTTGRPVQIFLVDDSTDANGGGSISLGLASGAANMRGNVKLLVGSSTYATLPFSSPVSSGGIASWGPSLFFFVHPGASTYTYKVQAKATAPATTAIGVQDVKLCAFEL